jgi:hypothetical protein
MPSLVLEEKYPTPLAPSAPTAIVVGVGITSEATGVSTSCVDRVIPPPITFEATFESISENSLTAYPTVEVSTESITP